MIDLRQGDCLELMKDIPDKSIDMILADLPYGTTRNKWDIVIDLTKLWEQYERIIKDNGAIVLFGSEPFATKVRISNLNRYKYDWIWVKERGTGFASARKRPMKRHEVLMVFYKKQPKYDYIGKKLDKPYKHALPIYKSDSDFISNDNGDIDNRVYKTYTHTTKNNILEFSRDSNKLHPTQKPVALLEYLIKTYTNEGDTVLDNVMGSGSTGVACKNLNRNFIGIELDEKYFKIAKERIESHEVE